MSKTRILLVDDEKELLVLTKAYIDEFHPNIEIFTYSSTNEALALIKKESFDAIISDYQLPTIDGLDFLAQLRDSGNKTPFIMFTSRGSEEVASRTLNLGGDYYLQKGADPKSQFPELLNFIEKAIVKKQTEDALIVSDRRFTDFAENAVEWIWETDSIGKYIFSSSAVEKILGYTIEEILGKHFYDLFHPDDKKALEVSSNAIIKGKKSFFRTINRYLHKNGDEIWLLSSGVPILDKKGKLLGYRGIDSEITDIMKADRALKDSENNFRRLAEKASDFIWTTNLNFELTYANPFVEQFLGYTTEEAIKLTITDILTPGSFKLAMFAFEDEMRIEKLPDRDLKRTRSLEMECLCKDGSNIWGETNFSFLRDPEGAVIGLLGVTRDITTRKQMEQKVERQQQQILKQRNELDLFAGTITHDLRGKIQVISLLNEMDDHKNRAVLAKQIDKMSLFITNLFLYAKKGEFIGEESEIDLTVLVERIISKHYSGPSKQVVRLKKLPILNGDPIRFAQLFDNLIRNVEKHSGATKVEIYSEEDKKGYRIFIRDNGKGISQDNLNKIIKTLTTKEYSSFGFLIISKIVQAYCGDLVIESVEGKGTTVIISLPKECIKKPKITV